MEDKGKQDSLYAMHMQPHLFLQSSPGGEPLGLEKQAEGFMLDTTLYKLV